MAIIKCKNCGQTIFPELIEGMTYWFHRSTGRKECQRDSLEDAEPKGCPYNFDCDPDIACKQCKGEVMCPRCQEMKWIPKHRNLCFECTPKSELE